MSIAMAIMDIVLQEAVKHRFKKIKRIKVQIGELAAVVPQALTFSFSVIRQNTPLESAELDIEIVPPVAQCDQCNLLFEVEELSFRCPKCDRVTDHYVTGQELMVTCLEGEKEE